MNQIHEGKIVPLVIDFEDLRQKKLEEFNILTMFGAAIKNILSIMFGGMSTPLTVRGTNSEIASFLQVLQKEKKYADSFMRFGLHNPSTYRDKYKLNDAVKNFERTTGLIYPIH